jgi:hypothetical protein
MGMISYDLHRRAALLVCDDCDGVLLPDGTKSDKKHRDSDPSDLAPLHRFRDDLVRAAQQAGWVEANERWTCPDCGTSD